jgi:hypothetical protein
VTGIAAIRRISISPAVIGSHGPVRSVNCQAGVLPVPVAAFPQHADHPPPGEVVQHGEDVLGHRVPEVVDSAVHDLVQPGQHVSQVQL